MPQGFLAVFHPLTVSHQISISFSLMRSLDPSSSLFASLCVPLNLSVVFAHFASVQLVIALNATPSLLTQLFLPSSFPSNSPALPLFLYSAFFYFLHPLEFSLSSQESQEEIDKVLQFLKDKPILYYKLCFNGCKRGRGLWSIILQWPNTKKC